jgi:hypothetical protein
MESPTSLSSIFPVNWFMAPMLMVHIDAWGILHYSYHESASSVQFVCQCGQWCLVRAVGNDAWSEQLVKFVFSLSLCTSMYLFRIIDVKVSLFTGMGHIGIFFFLVLVFCLSFLTRSLRPCGYGIWYGQIASHSLLTLSIKSTHILRLMCYSCLCL